MITIIAAVGKNLELGKNNDLIWNLPNDLQFFKEKTLNGIIVMGSKTFFSLPKMLPNRFHIVLDNEGNIYPEGVLVFSNLDDLLEYIKDKDVWIIGGASVYKIFIDLADKMYLTEIDAEAEADVYFPEFDKLNWNKEIVGSNSDGSINYKHVLYERVL